MTSYTWKGVSGYWRTARDWTPAGGPPTASDAATINGSGTYTVKVHLSDFANSLTLSGANATLNSSGSSQLPEDRRVAHDERWDLERLA